VGHRYQLLDKLGAGGYGFVAKARDHERGCLVAIKRVRATGRDKKRRLLPPSHGVRIAREVALLRRAAELRLPGLLQLDRVLPLPPGPAPPEGLDVYIVTEALDANLGSVLAMAHVQLLPAHVAWFSAKLLLATALLHALGVVHRDIKASNVFITAANRLVLGDFGLSRASEPLARGATAYVYTRHYRAPELLTAARTVSYTAATDMWAVGCVLAELAAAGTGRAGALFPGATSPNTAAAGGAADAGNDASQARVIERVLAALNAGPPEDPLRGWRARFPGRPDALLEVLRGLLQPDPRARLTAEGALESPALAGQLAPADRAALERARGEGAAWALRWDAERSAAGDGAAVEALLRKEAEGGGGGGGPA
jgi:serine/threonine protein kinase